MTVTLRYKLDLFIVDRWEFKIDNGFEQCAYYLSWRIISYKGCIAVGFYQLRKEFRSKTKPSNLGVWLSGDKLK